MQEKVEIRTNQEVLEDQNRYFCKMIKDIADKHVALIDRVSELEQLLNIDVKRWYDPSLPGNVEKDIKSELLENLTERVSSLELQIDAFYK